ncbi:sensor histidine kinase [Xanthocytophaga flava]|uniref:sensor histidine kinase n=1 Tax=Xanthocytophaga flava TaxID=3048013 RepID=UPI0028D13D78|nr:HAMP domain-containing sensor histidine kinase [Xanthocytophaga flavus]MDJ1470330.1 HAMP domain-containing sensor histidine kinase [Xanthocytophaga flavus]
MRLLTRTVQSYSIYSGLLLLIAIPVFYLILNQLVIDEIDKVLFSHKRDFAKASVHLRSIEDIQYYPLLNEEFFITPVTHTITLDSFYTELTQKPGIDKPIPFRVMRTGITILGKPYELLVKESLIESKDLIATIIYTQSALIAVLLIGLILINRRQSKKVWRPFYDMLQKLKQYDIHTNEILELSSSEISEFQDMRQAIYQLVGKDRQAFLSQKEFTENASHEIQTPLAVFSSKLDLLMQTHELTSEQAELVHQMSEVTHQLSRLNRNLVLLTKIENAQFYTQKEIPITDLVKRIWGQMESPLHEKEIEADLSLHNFTLMANETMLEVLIVNLLGNAVRYTPQNGTIRIEIENEQFKVQNSGSPLHNPEKIFDRFYRDLSDSSGSGLGLAIVSRICSLHNYTLSYQYANGYHVFQVLFV